MQTILSIALAIVLSVRVEAPLNRAQGVPFWGGVFALPEMLAFVFAYEWVLRVRRTVPARNLYTAGPDRLLRIAQGLALAYGLLALAFVALPFVVRAVEPVLLFLIIFFWTPPHFWALSLWRSGDYARAGIPMLPVVSGVAETKRQILLHACVLAPIGVSPWLVGLAGPLYGVVATVAGVQILALAVRLKRAADAAATDRLAKRLFGFSLSYLFALFAVLLIDHWVDPWVKAGLDALARWSVS